MRMVRDLVDDRLIRSVQLWAAVAATGEYSAAAGVMAFVGCKGEPDTDPLFARLAADGKRLLLPRVHEGDIVVCDGSGPMAVSRFGISEPTGPALPFEEVGLVIVPGLAFTPAGWVTAVASTTASSRRSPRPRSVSASPSSWSMRSPSSRTTWRCSR
jgi:5,10-methenyltetrahydrofolate synthetase